MRTFTKRIVAVFAMLFVASMMYAQMPEAISISPETATADDELTLTLEVSKACVPAGKNAVAGKVCMHSGYGELSDPNSWKNVVDWDKQGKDSTKTELKDNGDGTWSITFTPKTYFGIEDGVVVSQLNAVFNGCDNWASEAKDNDGSGGCIDFFIPIKFKTLKPSIVFKLNMNKMIADGQFDGSAAKTYVEVEGFKSELMLDIDGQGNTDGIFELAFEDDNLQDSTDYDFKFYFIDIISGDTTFETITQRNVDVAPGKNIVSVWWNDVPQAITTLQLDMSAQIANSLFDESTQYVDVAGSFNGWDGKDHHLAKVGPGLYEVQIALTPGTTYEYKFRIDGDWNNSEFPGGGPNRKHIGTQGSYTLWHLYDNYNPATWTVELQCDMHYQLSAGHFDPAKDFLDVAGNFEGWNGGIVLSDWDMDSIYSAYAFVDTASLGMEFKFRYNGDWNTSEFPGGGPNRKWTPDSNMSVFYAWYNDDDPAIPAKPMAKNLKITGELYVGETLTGSYDYEDVNGDAEGMTLTAWFKADDAMGTNLMPIAGAVSKTLELTAAENGKIIAFVVVPIDFKMDMGDTNYTFRGPVMPTSIEDEAFKNVRIYPNPATSFVNLTNVSKIDRIDIYTVMGVQLQSIENIKENNIVVNTANYENGIYFFILRSQESSYVYRLIKR